MRITRKMLLNLAHQAVLKRTDGLHDVEAVYLIGSAAELENPLLGGSVDIDLVFIHRNTPSQTYEREAISPDIHLDILHRSTREYEPIRTLRTNAWRAPELYAPRVLFKTGFFFDRLQAALLSEYDDPRHTLARARQFLEHGRGIWFDLQTIGALIRPNDFNRYLKALLHAANALTALDNRPPLSERRFLPQLQARAAALGQDSLATAFIHLLCPREMPTTAELDAWLTAWQDAWDAAIARKTPSHKIHPARRNYYLGGFRALRESERPHDLLWPLLVTWTLTVLGLDADAAPRQRWEQALQRLGLGDEGFRRQVAALDAFLDQIDILLEDFAAQIGLG
jgi:hypothetical protein